MSLVNIISAIGNNNSIVPLFIRDCCIEVPTKVAMTYNQNKSDKNVQMLATRERFFDEYITSAVWLGGIPLLEKLSKSVIKSKGFNSDIDVRLLKDDGIQGLERNITTLKKSAPEAVRDLEFLKNNKSKYMKLIAGKVFAESIVPMLLMGFVIPKVLFAWTAKTKTKLEKTQGTNFKKSSIMYYDNSKKDRNDKEMKTKDSDNITFRGDFISGMAELSTVQKMLVTDGGYSVGRVLTARNAFAAIDTGFKMLGMLFLNFIFPKFLAKALNKIGENITNTCLDLDIKLLADKKFAQAVKNKQIIMPAAKDGKEILNFIDKNPNALFSKYAKKYQNIKFLDNGIRDPRSYVDLGKLKEFRNGLDKTVKKATQSKDVTKFMKKAKIIQGVNILLNVSISSFLLAWGLPKLQFTLRKLFTNCELEPGILD